MISNPLKDKKIAFFEPHSDFGTNPSLVAIYNRLVSCGANVEIFGPISSRFRNGRKKTFSPFPYSFFFSGFSLFSKAQELKRYIFNHSWKSHSLLKRKKYDLVFGIDSEGVIVAWNYAKNKNIPIIYLSFEIFFHDELINMDDFKQKACEIIASQHSSFTVIQDEVRKSMLARENNIPLEKFINMPVVADDLTNYSNEAGNYLREKYSIAKDKTIVLHSGSFEEWTCANELIDVLHKLPDNIVMVIHIRSETNSNEFIKRVKRIKRENIIVSVGTVDTEEYNLLISSADIGLVLYKKVPDNKYLQKNIEHIGYASGKFSGFLKYDIPIISLNQKAYKIMLKDNQFGINIKDIDSLPNAINNITNDYDNYSKQANIFYNKELKFDLYWEKLYSEIITLVNT